MLIGFIYPDIKLNQGLQFWFLGRADLFESFIAVREGIWNLFSNLWGHLLECQITLYWGFRSSRGLLDLPDICMVL